MPALLPLVLLHTHAHKHATQAQARTHMYDMPGLFPLDILFIRVKSMQSRPTGDEGSVYV